MWLPQFISWCLIRLKLSTSNIPKYVYIELITFCQRPHPTRSKHNWPVVNKRTNERTNKGLLFLPIVSGFLFKWWHFANGRLSGKHLARIIRDNVPHLSMLESSIQFLRIEVCSQELYGALQDSYSASPVCLLTQML